MKEMKNNDQIVHTFPFFLDMLHSALVTSVVTALKVHLRVLH